MIVPKVNSKIKTTRTSLNQKWKYSRTSSLTMPRSLMRFAEIPPPRSLMKILPHLRCLLARAELCPFSCRLFVTTTLFFFSCSRTYVPFSPGPSSVPSRAVSSSQPRCSSSAAPAPTFPSRPGRALSLLVPSLRHNHVVLLQLLPHLRSLLARAELCPCSCRLFVTTTLFFFSCSRTYVPFSPGPSSVPSRAVSSSQPRCSSSAAPAPTFPSRPGRALSLLVPSLRHNHVVLLQLLPHLRSLLARAELCPFSCRLFVTTTLFFFSCSRTYVPFSPGPSSVPSRAVSSSQPRCSSSAAPAPTFPSRPGRALSLLVPSLRHNHVVLLQLLPHLRSLLARAELCPFSCRLFVTTTLFFFS